MCKLSQGGSKDDEKIIPEMSLPGVETVPPHPVEVFCIPPDPPNSHIVKNQFFVDFEFSSQFPNDPSARHQTVIFYQR